MWSLDDGERFPLLVCMLVGEATTPREVEKVAEAFIGRLVPSCCVNAFIVVPLSRTLNLVVDP